MRRAGRRGFGGLAGGWLLGVEGGRGEKGRERERERGMGGGFRGLLVSGGFVSFFLLVLVLGGGVGFWLWYIDGVMRLGMGRCEQWV